MGRYISRSLRQGGALSTTLTLVLAWLMPVTACLRTQTTVLPAEVLRHAEELSNVGQARVQVKPLGVYLLRADKMVRPNFDSGPLTLSIRQLISDCPGTLASDAISAGPDRAVCLLHNAASSALVLETSTRVDWKSVRNWTAQGAVVGAITYCGFECDYPVNGFVVFGSLLGVLGVGIYYFAKAIPTH